MPVSRAAVIHAFERASVLSNKQDQAALVIKAVLDGLAEPSEEMWRAGYAQDEGDLGAEYAAMIAAERARLFPDEEKG